jgi:hypothetical protein
MCVSNDAPVRFLRIDLATARDPLFFIAEIVLVRSFRIPVIPVLYYQSS